jgi:hypothetical protein
MAALSQVWLDPGESSLGNVLVGRHVESFVHTELGAAAAQTHRIFELVARQDGSERIATMSETADLSV